MLTATILATTLYITPVYKSGGQFGTFGMKFTQKVSDGIFFKIRVFNKFIQLKPTWSLISNDNLFNTAINLGSSFNNKCIDSFTFI